ncbi:MAG TPA: hypothetical protein P5056_04210 [Candidatus Paceibacterota bacterium]|nr:hypothetical protein [Candidatus Paceibacterota bacterium]
MILIKKKRGETPLQALCRIRKNKPGLASEKLSYIGRLDPMAEGEMILLVGEKENKERKKYLNFDKEYEAVFLAGVSTDSGDILGFLNKTQNKELPKEKIKCAVENLKKIKSQKYPWMSGKTISGKKMFDIYKEGDAEDIKRPSIKVKIHKISNLRISRLSKKKLESDILKIIPKVAGDFRQKETIKKWNDFLAETNSKYFQTFSFKIKVSSGTFIRGFCEELEKYLDTPTLLYRLKRTKIFYK